MHGTYRLNANDLNSQFIDSLRTLFKDKDIEIIVTEVDETAYLLGSEANRDRLLQSIQNISDRTNLIDAPLDKLN